MTTQTTTQAEFLELALKLQRENPEAKIRVFVPNDEIGEEGHFSLMEIHKVEISFYCTVEEHIFTDEDDCRDYMESYQEMSSEDASAHILQHAEQAVVIWVQA